MDDLTFLLSFVLVKVVKDPLVVFQLFEVVSFMESLLYSPCDDFYDFETPQDQEWGRGTWGAIGRERLTLYNTKIRHYNNQQNFN